MENGILGVDMSMRTRSSYIGLSQVKELVDRLPRKDKEALARYLEEQTLFTELRKVQKDLRNAPLSEEEIQAEVRTVRRPRS